MWSGEVGWGRKWRGGQRWQVVDSFFQGKVGRGLLLGGLVAIVLSDQVEETASRSQSRSKTDHKTGMRL